MGKLIHIFLIAFIAASARAQPVDDPVAKAPAPLSTDAKQEKVSKPAVKAAGPISPLPSRNVGASDMQSYVESIASIFQIRERERDSFGQSQDPDAKPVIKVAPEQKPKRPQPVLAVQFAEIIQKIVVTTIMPGEQRFLIGTRSVKRGDHLPLSFRGKQIRVQVTEVTAQQIGFRNLDTGEAAFRKLDMLPAGMTPGINGITAPGMIADRVNAPIELESGDPSPGNFTTGNSAP